MIKKLFKAILGISVVVLGVALGFVQLVSFQPKLEQPEEVICPAETKVLKPGQRLKLLSWNVQYFAGKNYVFYYDVVNLNKEGKFYFSGPDLIPSKEDIDQTFKEVVRVIRDENPDVVLLQEVEEYSRRSHYENQLERLLKMLDGLYPCSSSSFYWKTAFVPHPTVWGAADLKLAALSKYKIDKSTRHQLAIIPRSYFYRELALKRAVHEIELPIAGSSKKMILMNTHLSAFPFGTDTSQRQIKKVKRILEGWTQKEYPWVFTGGYNLLPPGRGHSVLPPEHSIRYPKDSPLQPLFDSFSTAPTLTEMNGSQMSKWFTTFGNDPRIKGPDRILDFYFYSDLLKVGKYRVRQHDTLKLSDHLPVIAEFSL